MRGPPLTMLDVERESAITADADRRQLKMLPRDLDDVTARLAKSPDGVHPAFLGEFIQDLCADEGDSNGRCGVPMRTRSVPSATRARPM
jgi:hypothetical protein